MNAHASLSALDPELSDQRFTVPGMRCAGCISKIGARIAAGAPVSLKSVTKRVVRHDA
jgi:hypothetical protein